jgi:hypothetical protein
MRFTPPRRAKRRIAGFCNDSKPEAIRAETRTFGDLTPPVNTQRRINTLTVMPWMLSRRTLRWRFAPPLPASKMIAVDKLRLVEHTICPHINKTQHMTHQDPCRPCHVQTFYYREFRRENESEIFCA